MVRDDMALQDYSQYEWPHDKTNKMACVPSEDPDQPGHPPSLIRVFAFRMKKAWVLSYPLSAQGRRGIMLYPPKIWSVRPSVSTSFPDSSLSRFDRFSSNFAWTLISGRSGLELQMS